MARILLIRLSAFGDVAMTVPVVHALATDYPQHEVCVLTRANWALLFDNLPRNLRVIGADPAGRHKGWGGLNRLYAELKRENFDAVADLHGVLRSRYLTFRFRLGGVPVATIVKGRCEKRRLVRARNKVLRPLATSFQRYADVLHRLGYPVRLNFTSIYADAPAELPREVSALAGDKGDNKWIGIAPFAKHKGKIYPPELQERVIAHFAGRNDVKVFLFGGGAQEREIIAGWAAKYPAVRPALGLPGMSAELALMSRLDVMLTMDSANMHLASLVGVPVVSVWGATHPYAGFMGWGQSVAYAVQLDMPCRPCSVFGQKPCLRDDYACLNDITPEMVIARVESLIDAEAHQSEPHS